MPVNKTYTSTASDALGELANVAIENGQSYSSRLPRIHGHIYRCSNYLRLRRDLYRRRRLAATGQLSDLVANCHSGRRAIILEAPFAPIRTTPDLPLIPDSKLRLQYRLRQEPGLRFYGCLSGLGLVLHFACYGDWQWCGDRDVLST